MGLSDLDELVLKCRTEEAKSRIGEAVKCYEIGAYRSCIIMTWITIVFDIIDKIKELSRDGDANAEKIIKQFETYQRQVNEGNPQGISSALKFERGILETAKNDFGLFDHQQYLKLDQLHDDRHHCAHPSFQYEDEEPYNPSPELARLHLRNAIEYVLMQQPVQGKQALNKLKNIIYSDYSPANTEGIIEILKNSPLQRPTDSLIRNFIKMLIFDLFSDNLPPIPKDIKVLIYAIEACLKMHRKIARPCIDEELRVRFLNVKDEKIPLAIFMIFVLKESWDYLNSNEKSKISNYILNGPINIVLALVERNNFSELEEIIKERLSKMDTNDLSAAIIRHNLGIFVVDTAVKHYCTVTSWASANNITDRLILPLLTLNLLTEEHIAKILEAAGERKADLIGSAGFNAFLARLRGAIPLKLYDLIEKNNLKRFMDEDILINEEILLYTIKDFSQEQENFLASCDITLNDFEIEILSAPHKPTNLPSNKMAVFGFYYYGEWIAFRYAGGSGSNPLFKNHHYNSESMGSSVANKIFNDVTIAMREEKEDIGDWMKKNLGRINILIPEHENKLICQALVKFLDKKFEPRYKNYSREE